MQMIFQDPMASLNERSKKLLVYDPSVHHYEKEGPKWVEILPGHFVYGNSEEMDGYRKEIGL